MKILRNLIQRLGFGNRIPEDMKERFREMIGSSSNTPNRSYFVKLVYF